MLSWQECQLKGGNVWERTVRWYVWGQTVRTKVWRKCLVQTVNGNVCLSRGKESREMCFIWQQNVRGYIRIAMQVYKSLHAGVNLLHPG